MWTLKSSRSMLVVVQPSRASRQLSLAHLQTSNMHSAVIPGHPWVPLGYQPVPDDLLGEAAHLQLGYCGITPLSIQTQYQLLLIVYGAYIYACCM